MSLLLQTENIQTPRFGATACQTTCGACHQVGHTRRNARLCPKFIHANVGAAIPSAAKTQKTAKRAQIRDNSIGQTKTPRVTKIANENESGDDGSDSSSDEATAQLHQNLAVADLDHLDDRELDEVEDEAALPDGVYEWEEVPLEQPRESRSSSSSGGQANHQIPVFRTRALPREGPINIPPNISTPLQVWKLLMSDAICTQFVQESNGYAASEKIKGFVPFTIDFLRVLFAIILFLGVVRVPDRRGAFSRSSLFGQPFLYDHMAPKRFEDGLKALHWINTAVISPLDQAVRRAGNSFWQVDTFLTELATNFREYYSLGQEIDIDEMTVGFKGRHSAKCYNPNKPEKWHLKFFALNDAATGYLWNFYAYSGKSEARPAAWCATAYPVFKLIGAFDVLHHRNHILSTDNWYTQMQILIWCIGLGIHVVGTVKTNRRGIPRDQLFMNTGARKVEKGLSKALRTVIDGISYYCVSWMDHKVVNMLCTYLTGDAFVLRNASEVGGRYAKVMIRRPSCIADYNSGMGGTDLFDQFCSYYKTTVRTKKWPMRIFTHFLKCTVVNAYIIWNALEIKSGRRVKKVSLLDFTDMLIKEIIAEHWNATMTGDACARASAKNETPVFEHATKPARLNTWMKHSGQRLNGTHTPIQLKNHKGGPDLRTFCMVCNVKCPTRCNECNCALHITEEDGDLSCWSKFHMLEDFTAL